MDFRDIKNYAEECLRDAPPPCVSACPLRVDVRDMVSKVQRGRLGAAYRTYRKAVLFPRVVSAFCEAPCREACVRERLAGGGVDLPAIEREITAGAAGREAERYAIPKKGERVAVIGAGLSALACAWRLASKGYGIEVFGAARPGAGSTGADGGAARAGAGSTGADGAAARVGAGSTGADSGAARVAERTEPCPPKAGGSGFTEPCLPKAGGSEADEPSLFDLALAASAVGLAESVAGHTENRAVAAGAVSKGYGVEVFGATESGAPKAEGSGFTEPCPPKAGGAGFTEPCPPKAGGTGADEPSLFDLALAADVEDLFRNVDCEWRAEDAPLPDEVFDAFYDAPSGPEPGTVSFASTPTKGAIPGPAGQIALGLAAASAIEEQFRLGELSGAAPASAGSALFISHGTSADTPADTTPQPAGTPAGTPPRLSENPTVKAKAFSIAGQSWFHPMIRLYCGKKLRSRTISSFERPEIPRKNAKIDKKTIDCLQQIVLYRKKMPYTRQVSGKEVVLGQSPLLPVGTPPPLAGTPPQPAGAVDERFYGLDYDFESADGETEADRCLLCNCSACIDACPMIRRFKQNPKRISADLGVSLLPVGGKIMRVGSRMMNSCNLCGLCAAVCPVGVDTRAAMEAGRRILKESGHMAPAYHDFWMEDFSHAMSEKAYGVVFGSERREDTPSPTPLLFFPGCQLSASLPDTVARTFDYICEKAPGAAMLLSCCGAPADWAAESGSFAETATRLKAEWAGLGEPRVLFACSACKRAFAKVLPEVQGDLVYEWLCGTAPEPKMAGAAPKVGGAASQGAGTAPEPKDDFSGTAQDSVGSVRAAVEPKDGSSGTAQAPVDSVRAAVYDPCNSRDDKAGQAAVRKLAKDCGFSLEELALCGEEAACCGFGGHIYPANPGLLEAILEERAADRPDLPRITYCANCRDLFIYHGMESAHILEILFPAAPEEAVRKYIGHPKRIRNYAKKLRLCTIFSGKTSENQGKTRENSAIWLENHAQPKKSSKNRPCCGMAIVVNGFRTAWEGAGALPTLSERRENRRRLKDMYTGFLPPNREGSPPNREGPPPSAEGPPSLALDIPPGIEAKMDRLLLLREDVEKTIARCEEKNAKAIDTGSGHSIGYFRNRLVTVWVEYEICDGERARVYNVYTHRMKIED